MCENGWLNFPESLRVMALILFELTQFLSPNQSIIYNNFCTVLGSVVTKGHFPFRVHLWRSLWFDVSDRAFSW